MSGDRAERSPRARPLTAEEWKVVAARRLRAVDAAPYLASLLLAMPIFAVDGVLASVDRSARLYLDVDRFAELDEDEAVGLLLHEVGHVVHGHAERATRRGVLSGDRTTWNIAADLTINDDLRLGGFALPEGGVSLTDFDLRPGCVVETYYDELLGRNEEQQHSCGSGAGGEPQPHEIPDQGHADDGDTDGLAPGLSPIEIDLHRRHVAEAITAHAARHGIGSLPGGLRAWAEAELRPPAVSWRDVLRTAVRRPLQIAGGVDDYTWRRPNRRRQSGDVILPATITNVPTVAVVLDTSGSIQPADLAAFVGEISGMVAQFRVQARDVMVICCDRTARPPVTADRVLRGVELPGGGGTDMGVGIAAAAGLRPRPDVIVVFTDGKTPWPTDPPPCPMVVALSSGRRHAPTPAWATTVIVEDLVAG